MALAERKDGDAAELARVVTFNRQLEQHIIEQRALANAKVEHLIGSGSDNILSRLLICNSDGQHKLPKAKRRLSAADINGVDVNTVEIPLMPQGAPASDKDDYSIF